MTAPPRRRRRRRRRRNNLPLSGWHRDIQIHDDDDDATVSYWPPVGAGEKATDERALRSRAEVREWLAQCNAIDLLPLFDFDAASCLRTWPRGMSNAVIRGQLGAAHRCDVEIYVETALGYRVGRTFEFVDEPTFRFTHDAYLRTQRASVVDDIVRQCVDEKRRRLAADADWRIEKMAYLPRAAQRSSSTQHELRFDRLTLRARNVLYHVAAGEEDSRVEDLGRGLYRLELFDPEYCELLATEARAFGRGGGAGLDPLLMTPSTTAQRVSLDKMGLGPALANPLLDGVVAPLARVLLFPDSSTKPLDHHLAFFESFNSTPPPPYAMPDDADVTLDVCLDAGTIGDDAAEPTRAFHGSYADPVFPPIEFRHATVGQAIVYRGDGLLRRLPTSCGGGDSIHLVLWCRSSSTRRSGTTTNIEPTIPADDPTKNNLVVVLPRVPTTSADVRTRPPHPLASLDNY